MPTIEVSRKTLEQLAGRSVSAADIEKCKAELDEDGEAMKIEVGDTNRPDLWSVEGIARCIREEVPKLSFSSSGGKVIASSEMSSVREFVCGFAAKGVNLTDELLSDIIQMQEKIVENFGKKREKVSVGIYNLDMIKFPVHYRLADPAQTRFVPLDFEEELSLGEILEKHPKGREYSHIISSAGKYPILIDSNDRILSFPPIINSNDVGRVTPESSNLFVEVTGTDLRHILVVANIFAFALSDRKAKILSVDTEYESATPLGKTITCPYIFGEVVSVRKDYIRQMLGIELADKPLLSLLKKMQYSASVKGGSIEVVVPPYRNDVMHPADVVEDIAIAYGYDNIEPLDITSHTAGCLKPETLARNRVRRLMVGLGFQEYLSPILSSISSQTEKISAAVKVIEIENPITENYSCVRSAILPSLLNMLSKNLHQPYPQKAFEVGEVVGPDTETRAHAACVISRTGADYADVSSALHALLDSLPVKYSLSAAKHPSFIEGRCAKVSVNGRAAGYVGEIHPSVLNAFSLEKPVAAFELDLEGLMQKK